jgi:hypothetical protein
MASNKPTDPDSPKVFNLNAVKAEADEFPPFRFVFGPNGERWEMTHQELISQIPVYEATVRGDAEGTLKSLQEAFGEEQWQKFRKLTINKKQLDALYKEYSEHCGADEGESSGSTDS